MACCSSIRKDLCEAGAKPHIVFKFSDNFSALRCTTPTDEALGQVDIWSGIGSGWPLVRCTPSRDILWPSVIILWVRLTFGQTLGQVDLWSEVPTPHDEALGQDAIWTAFWTLVRCAPSRDILWPSVILLWISLPFGQMYPPGWGFGSGWILVRLTFGQMYPWQTSCDQVWYYFGSVWHLVRSPGQDDIWSDITPGQRHLVAKCDTTTG